MKLSKNTLWVVLTVVALVIAGCAKDNITGPGNDTAPPGATNETTTMQVLSTNDVFVQNDEETFDDTAIEPMDQAALGKLTVGITPLRFGRFVNSVTRNVSVTINAGDTIAVATVTKTIGGIFRIKGVNASAETVIVEKPFTDMSKRYVIFKRVDRDTVRFWRNWLPVASSLVDGHTVEPNNRIDIQQVSLFLPNGDTLTITDPNAFFLRYRWLNAWMGHHKDIPELFPGQRVKAQVTVRSNSSDTDLVSFRFGHKGFRLRAAFHVISEVNNGDGTYTRVFEKTWTVNPERGYFHFGIDAVTHETIFDDTAPYAVNWWGVPFRVF